MCERAVFSPLATWGPREPPYTSRFLTPKKQHPSTHCCCAANAAIACAAIDLYPCAAIYPAIVLPASTHQPPTRHQCGGWLSHCFDCLALTSRAAADVELVRLLHHLLEHSTPAADATPVRPLAVAFDCLALTSRAAADVELVRLLHHLLAHTSHRRDASAAARCRIRLPRAHKLTSSCR